MNGRFTMDGSDQLEQQLSSLCEKVRSRVLRIIPLRALQAIVLGGGYGRGEGGVWANADGDRPYNDLEFYLLLSSPGLLSARRYRPAVAHLAEELSHQAGIEVDLKVLGLRK